MQEVEYADVAKCFALQSYERFSHILSREAKQNEWQKLISKPSQNGVRKIGKTNFCVAPRIGFCEWNFQRRSNLLCLAYGNSLSCRATKIINQKADDVIHQMRENEGFRWWFIFQKKNYSHFFVIIRYYWKLFHTMILTVLCNKEVPSYITKQACIPTEAFSNGLLEFIYEKHLLDNEWINKSEVGFIWVQQMQLISKFFGPNN